MIKIDFYPNTTKYVENLQTKTAEIYELLNSYIEVHFKSIESFKTNGMKNFMPIYEVIGEKEKGDRIKLRICTDQVLDNKIHLSMNVYKPHYKDKNKWKFLYKTISYDEFFIAKQIKSVA